MKPSDSGVHFPRQLPVQIIVVPLLVVSLVAGSCWGQADSGYSISGTCLVWRTNEVVADATVHLVCQQGRMGVPKLVATTTTDEEGRFAFDNLDPPPSELRHQYVRYTIVCDAKDHPITYQYVYTHSDPTDIRLGVYKSHATLTGRVVDPQGQGVAGALVIPRSSDAAVAIGQGAAVTDAQGRFRIERLAEANPNNELKSIGFEIKSDAYPTVTNARAEVPGDVEFKLAAGCKLVGRVQNKETDRGVANVVVTAVPIDTGLVEEQTLTDNEGCYTLIVGQGNYNIQLEDAELVAPALQDIECRGGAERELQPLIATTGGWLTGRVQHPRTDAPVVWSNKSRISVGVFGPASPKRKVIDARVLDVVDDDGRFRVRVVPGDHYPYVINIQADRMAWDTDRQPPVNVPEGGVARCFIKVKVKRTDAEKVIDAKQAVAELPEDKVARTKAIIDKFRKLNHTVDETELWCALMKALIEIGDAAVLPLCAELDATDEQRMMRRLGYAIRGLNDKRAVPALIRAIPKTLQPAMSDYGLIVADEDLLVFMQAHDLDAQRQGKHFGFGRPVREIFGALNAITGKEFSETGLYHVHRAKDPRTLHSQQQQFQKTAQQWSQWWEHNWHDADVDVQFSEVGLPPLEPLDLSALPTGLNLSSDAEIDRTSSSVVVSPIGDDSGRRFFLDLDTGRSVKMPKSMVRDDGSAEAIKAATEWATKQKFDLICLPYQDDDGKTPFILCGVGMSLWEIDPLDAKNIAKRVAQGELPEGRRIDDSRLLHFDPLTKTLAPLIGSSFLFLTREDSLGVITITDVVTKQQDITGMFAAPKGVGFNLGVRFDYKTIAR